MKKLIITLLFLPVFGFSQLPNFSGVTAENHDNINIISKGTDTIWMKFSKPIIVLAGQSTLYYKLNDEYVEFGASAYYPNNTEAVGTWDIDNSGVDVSQLGTYYVYYDFVDNNGIHADQVIRTIEVLEYNLEAVLTVGYDENYELGGSEIYGYLYGYFGSLTPNYLTWLYWSDYTISHNLLTVSGNTWSDVEVLLIDNTAYYPQQYITNFWEVMDSNQYLPNPFPTIGGTHTIKMKYTNAPPPEGGGGGGE